MVQKTVTPLSELYEADETAWLDAMVKLIRGGSHNELDYAHLVEFLEDNARRDRREIYCKLADLLADLLIWTHQGGKLPSTRRSEVFNHHFELQNWLDTPTLNKHAEAILEETYHDAVERASAEADVPRATFPPTCPWTIAQLLSDEVLDQ